MASSLRTALEALRAHHGVRVRRSPLDLSNNLQEKPIAKTSTLNLVRQYVMGVRGQQRSVIILVSRPACTRIAWSLFPSTASVRYRWFPSERNPADEQYHARFRVTSNSRLPRQCFSWLSSTHRVLTATLWIRRWRSSWSEATTRARHRTWPAGRLHQCGERFQTSHDLCHEASASLQGWKRLEPGSSRPPAPRVLVLLVARLPAEHNQESAGSLLLPILRNVHATVGRTGFARLPAPSADQSNSWSCGKVVTNHPSERARAAWQNRRVRDKGQAQ